MLTEASFQLENVTSLNNHKQTDLADLKVLHFSSTLGLEGKSVSKQMI